MRMLITLQHHACTFQHAVHAQLVQRRARLPARRIHRVPLLVQHFAQLRAVAAISLAVALCPTGARPSRQAAAHSHTARAVIHTDKCQEDSGAVHAHLHATAGMRITLASLCSSG
jgi:hypothetical protein